MGRLVVGDETHLDAQVEEIFKTGCTVKVGLLVGNWGSGGSRDSVFALVQTPMKDGEEAASVSTSDSKLLGQGSSRKASKRKPVAESSPMLVSIDWVAEHARQLSRMLLGGIYVVGVFVFCTEGTFKSSMPVLWQAVNAVTESVPLGAAENSELLLLHISSSPRRLSCRSCSRTGGFSTSALRPCEWKMGKLLNNLQEFSSTYRVDISYPVRIGEANNSLSTDLASAIAFEAKRLDTAHAVIDGSLVQPDQLLGTGSSVHTVDLLLPLDGGARAQPVGGGPEIIGKVTCKGEIYVRAYAVVRGPVSRAISFLKEDIVASLRSRLDLLVDEAEQAAGDAKVQNEDGDLLGNLGSGTSLIDRLSGDVPEHSFVLPRRVLVPWLQGAMISDYMLPLESFQDVQERVTDLLGVAQKWEDSAIMEPEVLGCLSASSKVSNLTDKHPVIDAHLDVLNAKAAVTNSQVSLTLLGAALVVLIAILLSCFLFS